MRQKIEKELYWRDIGNLADLYYKKLLDEYVEYSIREYPGTMAYTSSY